MANSPVLSVVVARPAVSVYPGVAPTALAGRRSRLRRADGPTGG